MAKRYFRVIVRICMFQFCGVAAGLMLIVLVSRHFDISQFKQKASYESVTSSRFLRGHRRLATTKNPLLVSPEPVKPDDMDAIRQYHSNEEEWCRQRIANKSDINWCPCVPHGLHGRVMVNMMDSNWTRISESVGSDVLMGGEWMPDDCVAHTRLAIVIPCRDRESHLRILLRHLYPILKRQQLHFRIFVVDQRFPMIFNKAAIMNIGFLEAQKRFPFDCVIFHDVDMLLEDDRALMTCGPNPRHYAQSVDRLEYLLYSTFGGVVSITPEMFRRVNGFALQFFGWGGEDDYMWARIKKFWKVYGPAPAVSRYSTIMHGTDVTNRKNPRRYQIIGKAINSTKPTSFEGLSDLMYAINSVELMPLFTRIEADINVTRLDYPQQRTSQYKRVHGFCLDSHNVNMSTGLSWASCRFQCDVFEKRPCFGFSYMPSKCYLIATVCNLVPLKNTWTFVKDLQFVQYALNSTARTSQG